MNIHGVEYPRQDSLGYYYISKINNQDGTITTHGWIPGRQLFIQKVWRSSSDFSVVAVFKPKKVLHNRPVTPDRRPILPNNIL